MVIWQIKKKKSFSLVWGSFKCSVRLFEDVKSQQVSVICCLSMFWLDLSFFAFVTEHRIQLNTRKPQTVTQFVLIVVSEYFCWLCCNMSCQRKIQETRIESPLAANELSRFRVFQNVLITDCNRKATVGVF